MIDLEKIFDSYMTLCKVNDEYPVAMLTIGDDKKQNIYFNQQISKDNIIAMLQEAILQISMRQDDSSKN